VILVLTLSLDMMFHTISRMVVIHLFLIGLIVLFSDVDGVHAQAHDFVYDEEEAQSIDRMLMCPVCPAENIDQAQVEIARQMRRLVREMLGDGATEESILNFFVERYGPSVLAAPPKSGFNLIAWIVPLVAVMSALAGCFYVLRSMKGDQRLTVTNDFVMQEELEPYLAQVDHDMMNRDLLEDTKHEADDSCGGSADSSIVDSDPSQEGGDEING
jgi:cytochrome c-type biogenesis protein CcmH